MEGEEEFLVTYNLLLTLAPVYLLKFVEDLPGKVETLPVDVVEVRSPAYRGLFALGTAADTINDPLQDTYVLAITAPEKICRPRLCGTN